MTLAMMFPGQGSQSVGMQAELAARYPVVRETWAQASDVLGYALWDTVQGGPAEKLEETVVTQPAMLCAGVAAWRAWQAAGGASPARMAGHSLGEYTALVAAGALDFGAALSLVRRRAEAMQAAVPAGEGAMAAILGLEDAAVAEACASASRGEVVSAVNYNAPGQVVIAGVRRAVERAMDEAKAAGARRAVLLPVSVPSHCDLMRPAAAEFAPVLAEVEFRPPAVPVIGNADVRAYEDAGDIRDGLARQLYSAVRWTETVRAMIASGATTLVECGPGKVLTGLARRIDRSATAVCVDSPEALADAAAQS